MDNDFFAPFKIRGSQILGLVKLAATAIETEGIKLKEAATAVGEPPNKIAWYNGSIIREYITGYSVSGGSWLTLVSNLFTGEEPEKNQRNFGGIIMSAYALSRESALKVEAEKNEPSRVIARADGSKGERTIIDGSELSNFLQLANEKEPLSNRIKPAKAFIKVGVTSITVNAQGGYVQIKHELGRTPKVVIPVMNSGGFQTNVVADSYTATEFRLGAYRSDGPNVGTQNVAWLAISFE